MHDGKQRTLKPMSDDQIKSDVVLVVHREKLHSAKPQPGLAKVQHEEHDTKSVSADIVSAEPVDDKPIVLVSDKPVEVKPHIDEGKDMSACVPFVPLPVHVDMGVQTDDGDADRVPVHTVLRVVSHSFVRTPRRRFVGAAVRVHIGKDERVHQLCGPGITTLQGHAKQVHVQQRKVPARLRRRRWRRLSTSLFGEEKRCNHLGLYQVEQAKREDVVRKASKT
jgi:hypothetical protein